jgi:hypothetical protein
MNDLAGGLPATVSPGGPDTACFDRCGIEVIYIWLIIQTYPALGIIANQRQFESS